MNIFSYLIFIQIILIIHYFLASLHSIYSNQEKIIAILEIYILQVISNLKHFTHITLKILKFNTKQYYDDKNHESFTNLHCQTDGLINPGTFSTQCLTRFQHLPTVKRLNYLPDPLLIYQF